MMRRRELYLNLTMPSLAFEVGIKICEHSELKEMSSSWQVRYESSRLHKAHGQYTDRVLNHIYLDFLCRSQSFPARSSLTSLFS